MRFAKKSLGQNFLIDNNIIRKIINLVKIKGKDIIEIGPGRGALTDEILKNKPKSLSLIEKDYFLAGKLKEKYDKNLVKIYNNDILKFDIEKITNNKNSIIFGNLPYNISSQILVKILKFKKWPPQFSDAIFMFQKELGQKIIAKYSSSNYGRLAILSNYRLNIFSNFLISNNCFFPKPKVNSMIIHFQPKKKIKPKIKKIDSLEKVTNLFFSNKRKMINKPIRKILSIKCLTQLNNLNTKLRPSEITPDIYYKITELYEKK